jgi:hypothetical protein
VRSVGISPAGLRLVRPTAGPDSDRWGAGTLRQPRALDVMIDHREFSSPIGGFALLVSVGGGSASKAVVSAVRVHLCALRGP